MHAQQAKGEGMRERERESKAGLGRITLFEEGRWCMESGLVIQDKNYHKQHKILESP